MMTFDELVAWGESYRARAADLRTECRIAVEQARSIERYRTGLEAAKRPSKIRLTSRHFTFFQAVGFEAKEATHRLAPPSRQ